MKIELSDHFDYSKLLRYALPSVIMLVVTSIYSVVDGFFVSNFVGKTPFAAINFIMPVLMISGSVGFMMGTGGGAYRCFRYARERGVLLMNIADMVESADR